MHSELIDPPTVGHSAQTDASRLPMGLGDLFHVHGSFLHKRPGLLHSELQESLDTKNHEIKLVVAAKVAVIAEVEKRTLSILSKKSKFLF